MHNAPGVTLGNGLMAAHEAFTAHQDAIRLAHAHAVSERQAVGAVARLGDLLAAARRRERELQADVAAWRQRALEAERALVRMTRA